MLLMFGYISLYYFCINLAINQNDTKKMRDKSRIFNLNLKLVSTYKTLAYMGLLSVH